jgi:BirA family transcriptional regulator, biotin operon repressor / biotin---[acetyl-CoA-carboxylase] ligase
LAGLEPDLHGISIEAYHQQAGKGRLERTWESEPGENITASLLLDAPSTLHAQNLGLLSKWAAAACHETLREYIGDAVQIKWPNDIYYQNKKLAGILIQTAFQANKPKHFIVGIGINLNQSQFQSEQATSLKLILGKPISMEDFQRLFYSHLREWFMAIETGNFELINSYYHAHLWGYLKDVSYQVAGEKKTGTIMEVRDDGYLLIREGKTIGSYDLDQIKLDLPL